MTADARWLKDFMPAAWQLLVPIIWLMAYCLICYEATSEQERQQHACQVIMLHIDGF